MKINRFICLMLLIVCSIFASYYGGNVSYALFYLSILIPVIAFLYTVYVYIRFKLYQKMDNVVVVKGDWTSYSFVIANEDFITFRNVKVNFLSDKSIIEATGQATQYCLLPNESEKLKTRIKCNYRGEYEVGVDSIEVTDFLYLFKITYPIATKLKAYVLPRVVKLEQLGIAPTKQDVKNPLRFSNATEEELDTEVRKYYPGDSRKRIHWKASARMHDLISRKYQYIPKEEIVIFMDLTTIKEEDLKVVITEDKIIESVLAISNYYTLRRIPSHIIFDMDGRKKLTVISKDDFNIFYRTCAEIRFQSKASVSELIMDRQRCGEEGIFYVTVTHYLTNELYTASIQAVSCGNRVCIVFISDDISENTKNIGDGLKQAGVNVLQIMSDDEIEEKFSC